MFLSSISLIALSRSETYSVMSYLRAEMKCGDLTQDLKQNGVDSVKTPLDCCKLTEYK